MTIGVRSLHFAVITVICAPNVFARVESPIDCSTSALQISSIAHSRARTALSVFHPLEREMLTEKIELALKSACHTPCSADQAEAVVEKAVEQHFTEAKIALLARTEAKRHLSILHPFERRELKRKIQEAVKRSCDAPCSEEQLQNIFKSAVDRHLVESPPHLPPRAIGLFVGAITVQAAVIPYVVALFPENLHQTATLSLAGLAGFLTNAVSGMVIDKIGGKARQFSASSGKSVSGKESPTTQMASRIYWGEQEQFTMQQRDGRGTFNGADITITEKIKNARDHLKDNEWEQGVHFIASAIDILLNRHPAMLPAEPKIARDVRVALSNFDGPALKKAVMEKIRQDPDFSDVDPAKAAVVLDAWLP